MKQSFILASASPRRRELLQQAGLLFDVIVSGTDEAVEMIYQPAELVRRLAEQKAAEVYRRGEAMLVLGADTAVVLEDRILGKPRNRQEAVEMLVALSGKTHRVITGIAVAAEMGMLSHTVETEVCFRTLSDEEIGAYVATGEPMDKAGAYGIQGGAAGFVRHIEGPYDNVVGLPVRETVRLLRQAGFRGDVD